MPKKKKKPKSKQQQNRYHVKGLDIMAYKDCLQEPGQEQKRHIKNYCLQLSGELSCGKELDLFCEALWGRSTPLYESYNEEDVR